MKAKPKNPPIYIIACTDLHSAYGPVFGLDLAVELCKDLNEESHKCLHVPVPFVPMMKNIPAVASRDDIRANEFTEVKDDGDEYRGGVYL